MKNVLVTGGGGFIGQGIVRALLARGLRVAVFGRNRYPEIEALGAECIVGDLRDLEEVRQAVMGRDTVFHVAAKAGIWGASREYHDINVGGTVHVIRACQESGVAALVYTSTPSVVFAGKNIEGGEETLPYGRRPLCAYARTKIEAERLVLAASTAELRTTAIRPHLVWGPGDRHLIPRLLERGRNGQLRIVGDGGNRVDISYIENVVHLHLLAAESLHGDGAAAGEAFFIGQERAVNLWDWINTLFRRLDIAPVRRRVPLVIAYLAGWTLEGVYALARWQEEPKMTRFLALQLARSHWFDHSKAKRLLAYQEQVGMEEGLDRLVSWLQTSGRPVLDEKPVAEKEY
ncbi:MAG: 3-beta hydroxysteroid dehydrogenase [Desulfobulbus propionicus]|nr:MAG: 3-beta hydroxysteroid dehydrogenase [Desulfobulbus propionicus]